MNEWRDVCIDFFNGFLLSNFSLVGVLLPWESIKVFYENFDDVPGYSAVGWDPDNHFRHLHLSLPRQIRTEETWGLFLCADSHHGIQLRLQLLLPNSWPKRALERARVAVVSRLRPRSSPTGKRDRPEMTGHFSGVRAGEGVLLGGVVKAIFFF